MSLCSGFLLASQNLLLLKTRKTHTEDYLPQRAVGVLKANVEKGLDIGDQAGQDAGGP